jgi:DNA-binding HxlR family transcriptional regulator
VKHYGQYCPIARTSEVLAERWTPIIIRNLLAGCRTFGELRSGAPGISKALLAQRLESLAANGILTSQVPASSPARVYALTDKGRALKAITDAMGSWGARWLELEPHDIDASYVLWATCRLVDVDRLPDRGLIVRVELGDRPGDQIWLMLRRPSPEVCSSSSGETEDLLLQTDSETLARWHLRHISYDDAVRSGRIRVEGPRALARLLVDSIRPSPFAMSPGT